MVGPAKSHPRNCSVEQTDVVRHLGSTMETGNSGGGLCGIGGFDVRRQRLGRPRQCDGGLHLLLGRVLTLAANEVVDRNTEDVRDGTRGLDAGVFANPLLDVSDVAGGETGETSELRSGQAPQLARFLQAGGEVAHQATPVAIDTCVVNLFSYTTRKACPDTIVAMSRAAEKPLPSPPRGSVWARIEEARSADDLSYGAFSELAGKKIGHYRSVGTRGWGAKQETRDAFVRALVSRGWSQEWLLLGVGDKRTDGKVVASPERVISAEDIRSMRWRAIQELVDVDRLDPARAHAIMDRVKPFPHPGLSWGDLHSAARHLAREDDEKTRDKAKKPAG